jgi:hypothetical protein
MRGFLSIRYGHAVRESGVNDPGYRFLIQQT